MPELTENQHKTTHSTLRNAILSLSGASIGILTSLMIINKDFPSNLYTFIESPMIASITAASIYTITQSLLLHKLSKDITLQIDLEIAFKVILSSIIGSLITANINAS